MPHHDPHTPRFAREPNLSLPGAFRIFIRETPPRVLLLASALLLGTRLASATFTDWGALGIWDLVVLVALALLHPFVEWCIHVYVLHWRPRNWLGLNIDFPAARYHRAHHVDPWDLRFVAMPLSAMFTGGALLLALGWATLPTLGALHSVMLMAACLALTYEWCHFLTHTSYRPKGWAYKRIYRFHRLHHFKNEKYWMGVTRHLADYVLGTMKDAGEVESSKTAKDLMASFEAEAEAGPKARASR